MIHHCLGSGKSPIPGERSSNSPKLSVNSSMVGTLTAANGSAGKSRGSKNGGDLGTTDQSRVLDLESGGQWHLRILQRGDGWRSDARRHIHFEQGPLHAACD